MGALTARVENGRLHLDAPTSLPEGTVVTLVIDDEGDDLSEEDREALHVALADSSQEAQSGDLRLASEVIQGLRKRP